MHSSIGPSDFTRVLVLLLLPLSNASICRAVWPESPAPAAEASKLSDTVNDDLQIARVMAATFNYCDSTYNRYFRQRDSQLVRHLFQRIADFLLDTAINADNLEEAIVNQSKTGFMKNPCTSHRRFAQMENGDAENGMITVYERTFRLPLSWEIENPLHWGKDSQGNPLPGFSCDGLGDHDSGWMKTMGSTLLHELMHWSYPFDDLSDFHYDIEESDVGYSQITNFLNPNPQPGCPPKGYGPYYSKMLRKLENDGMSSMTLQNVDNYVYFAVSKY